VLSDAALRDAYDKATEFDVECMAVEEYLRRFTYLILTVNGLGNGGWASDAPEQAEPLRLAGNGARPFPGKGAAQSTPRRC